MKIAIACDHGGFDLKTDLSAWLTQQGHQVEDFGCPGRDSCDYADFAGPAAEAVAEGRCQRGIVICTTGIGVSITANKVRGIRCALCSEPQRCQHAGPGRRRGGAPDGPPDCGGLPHPRL